jgi:hypothetical protein
VPSFLVTGISYRSNLCDVSYVYSQVSLTDLFYTLLVISVLRYLLKSLGNNKALIGLAEI